MNDELGRPDERFHLTVEIWSPNIDGLKHLLGELAARFSKITNYRDFSTAGGMSGGFSYSVHINAPIEAKIKALREEADRLEKGLTNAE